MSAISCRHIFSNSNIFRHFNLTEFYLTPGFTHIEMNDSEMEGEANGSFVQSLISCKIFLVSPRHILGISQAKNNPGIYISKISIGNRKTSTQISSRHYSRY